VISPVKFRIRFDKWGRAVMAGLLACEPSFRPNSPPCMVEPPRYNSPELQGMLDKACHAMSQFGIIVGASLLPVIERAVQAMAGYVALEVSPQQAAMIARWAEDRRKAARRRLLTQCALLALLLAALLCAFAKL